MRPQRGSVPPTPDPRTRIHFAALALACGLALAGCAGSGAQNSLRSAGPLRLSEVDDGGDPRRGASLWALSRGLAYGAEGQTARALVEYERAIQIDATNPYAYVALSRHSLELGDAERTLRSLDQAELLLGLDDESEERAQQRAAEDRTIERIRPHLDGLRGSALLALGREEEGLPLLERARARAPGVWGDGRLSAAELR